MSITPIAKEVALEKGIDAVPAVDLVADVNPADMDTDPEPVPLDKPVITVDQSAKKATWNAVDGAKEYEVTVKLGTEEKISVTVNDTQIDLSSLTEAGEYDITVEAIPEDPAANVSSRGTAKYTVTESSQGSGDGLMEGYFENMSIIRSAALEANIPFWVFIQTCSFSSGTRIPDEADILWQVNTALTYDAKGIQYFTGVLPSNGAETFTGAMFDRDGNRTDVYDYVKKANTQVKVVDEVLMCAKSKGIIAESRTSFKKHYGRRLVLLHGPGR